ncbi:MAG: hypothetical protein LQ339_008348 [Xanthoria mediterranea]|nr:MAG: hypothetical protein LQ339_008348 [Xanthoria mediterranea]
MEPLPPSSDPHANHNTLIIRIAAIFSVLSTTAVLMRLSSKRIKKTSLGWDDYLVIGSWVLTLVHDIVFGCAPSFLGMGRHAATLPPAKVTAFLKTYYAMGFLQRTSLATAKITMRVLGAIVALWWLGFTIADVFVCSPVRAQWEPQIPHDCRSQRATLIAGPVLWIVTDFAILIAPLFVIRILQLSLRDKIGLSALFLTGGATCITACYRYRTLFPTVRDPTWDTVDIGIWSTIDLNVTVIFSSRRLVWDGQGLDLHTFFGHLAFIMTGRPSLMVLPTTASRICQALPTSIIGPSKASTSLRSTLVFRYAQSGQALGQNHSRKWYQLHLAIAPV